MITTRSFSLLLLLFCWITETQAKQDKRPEQIKQHKAFVMGSLGDSISTAVNSTGIGAKTMHSWSTGYGKDGLVRSHFLRLHQLFPDRDIIAHNVAQGGATSFQLHHQVKEVNQFSPDYVTILIGGNDACVWDEEKRSNQIASYEKNVKEAISSLVKRNDQIKILLLPIPDMLALWELSTNTESKRKTCQVWWNFYQFCPSLLKSDVTADMRIAFQSRVDEANLALQRVADSFPQHVLFDLSLSESRFEDHHISKKDCFHPSGEGQNLIAELSWKSGWFR
ncbi:MAG: SGNH/GDSL hydrolase family protein [Deltaproteobacteria bacterium]|nr:SGNH/GDSL hydrolase family protein [Deltaproteobacteria bacterium]